MRKWKAEDKWDIELEKPRAERNIPKKRSGAPYGSKNALGNKGGHGTYGNQNAKGHGPPRGNQNALKTGEYATIWFDTLSIEEQCLLEKVDTDPLAQLNQDIMLLEIRERRMLANIKHLRENAEQGSLNEKIEGITLKANGKVVKEKKIVTKLLIDKLCAAEDALTRVQARKLQAIQTKHRIMQELGRYNVSSESGIQSSLGKLTEEELRNLAKFAET